MTSLFDVTSRGLIGPVDTGTVSQTNNKGTAVTLNTQGGVVTMNNAALAAGAEVNFTVFNSKCTANCVVLVNHASGGTAGSYLVDAVKVSDGSFKIMVSNVSSGSLSQNININFAIFKIA